MTRVDSLFIHYRWADRHVIAFCVGHPEYEAVEAFISHRRGRSPLVQAVLTRHDKRQIDYVNDPDVVAAMSATGLRIVHLAAVEIDDGAAGDAPRVGIRFADRNGDPVVLDLCAATPALPEFGGLTDPQGHAPDVLPVMWRARSALAGPGTALSIGGRPYGLAIDPAHGGTAAYYTEGFGIGILAAGGPGIARARAGGMTLETVGGPPRVRAIRVASSGETPSTLVVAFDPFLPEPGDPEMRAAQFAIAVDDHAGLVRGRVEARTDGVALVPDEPAWARSRAVALRS